ncbi:DUF6339 family protein [Ornithinibacillus halotolerans]|uniref:Uncharacterized protein n=1 Tax=Ornithinibacillus halotolerans TaxID=1274357 RepID=A0A916S1F1_9BACI|nr:DUF6339 family protein [Ornithinibacillus halotolerans]GGA80162.1 hypothetical protein GCM10008025_24450 [Ornithinibacillus halotolerans]
MKLKFLADETLMDLRTNFPTYKEHYFNRDNEWFDRYFQENNGILESKIDFEIPNLNFDEDYSISDRENVKLVYDALKHLTISQATQERLWSGLVHTQFRDFAYYRLKNEIAAQNEKRIETAMFFKNGKKRSLFVHILARLWWVGHMTYDETNESNPYWLTDFFCEKDFSARSVVFFASNFTSNPNITKGILKTLVNWKESGIEIKRDHFVQANKYLNVVGGAMILDMLSTEEVEEMVDGYLRRYYGISKIGEKIVVI